MAFADVLLDASWTIQYVQRPTKRLNSLHALFKHLDDQGAASQQLESFSKECCDYLLSQGRAEPKDELNDRTEKTGQLRECTISPIRHQLTQNAAPLLPQASGIMIETKYQKATYRVILLTTAGARGNDCPVSLILFKGNIGHIKHIKDWLGLKVALPPASQLQLPTVLLLQMFSEYLVVLTSLWPQSATHLDALRQAALKQIVGNVKVTISFVNAAGSEISPDLKTIDIDIPAETINILLDKAQKRDEHGSQGFLSELAEALHEKTGLKLPLSTQRSTASNGGDVAKEPPLKVAKITCAAFAVSGEGKIKFASRPVENAEVIGYDPEIVRKADQLVLDLLCQEANTTSAGDE